MLSTSARLVRAGRGAWAPRRRPRRSEWCEQNLRLASNFSANPGPISFVGREYQIEILDAIDDPSVREIVIMAAPQIGKTELIRCIVCSQGEVDAAPMMLAGPDQPYAREQRETIYQMCEDTPALRDKIPPENRRNDRWISLQRCAIFLAWSGSTQRLSGRSCKIVLCSEADRWVNTLQLAAARTGAFWRSCVLYEGSPIGESPNIGPLYEQSDRRVWKCPCPHCGHYQELRFFPHNEGPFAGRGGIAGIKDDRGNWLTPEEGRLSAYYLCEKEGCRIESGHKLEMIRRGVWVPEGCHVDAKGRLKGTPRTIGRRRGYQLSRILSPARSFGDVAEAWLTLRRNESGMQSFFNDWLGRSYRNRGKTPDWETLGRRLAGTHRRGTIPSWAYFLTAGADVQADRVYWVVRAWGHGCTSALVDFGMCLRDQQGDETNPANVQLASDLQKLTGTVISRFWPVAGENPLGYSRLAAARVGIDSGYRPTDVFAFVRTHPGDRVIAVAGDPRIVPGTMYRKSELEKNARTGEPYPDGTTRWGIETTAYKSDIQDRWFADPAKPGAWLLPIDILETDGGEDYLKQVVNERRRQENKKGKKTTVYEVITAELGNHDWDSEVYARALADMVVGNEWDSEKWPWNKPSMAEKHTSGVNVSAREHPQDDYSAR